MTPQEILNKKFERGMGGYKVEDVNAFLIEMSDYITSMQEERADLLEKMEIIAEKLEEYRADEDSLRTALLGAQKLGDSVVRESKKKANQIIADAEGEADKILAEARMGLKTEKETLKQMESEVSQFRAHILSLYESQIEVIKKLPYIDNPVPSVMPTLQVVQPTQPVQQVVQPVQQMTGEPNLEPLEQMQQQEDKAGFFTLNIEELEDDVSEGEESYSQPKKKSSRFTDLQFGEKYKVNREE